MHNFADLFENMARPRVLNTHNCVQAIPEGFRNGTGKVIFVQRNPKDIAVSFYNHLASLKAGAFKGTWDDFAYCVTKYGGKQKGAYLRCEDTLTTKNILAMSGMESFYQRKFTSITKILAWLLRLYSQLNLEILYNFPPI